MDKQIVLRAYNEILLSDIKKCSIKPPKGMEELKVHITIVKEAYVKRLYIVLYKLYYILRQTYRDSRNMGFHNHRQWLPGT